MNFSYNFITLILLYVIQKTCSQGTTRGMYCTISAWRSYNTRFICHRKNRIINNFLKIAQSPKYVILTQNTFHLVTLSIHIRVKSFVNKLLSAFKKIAFDEVQILSLKLFNRIERIVIIVISYVLKCFQLQFSNTVILFFN